MNFVPVEIMASDGGAAVRLPDGTVLQVPPRRAGALSGRRTVLLGIRPEHMHRERDTALPQGFGRLHTTVEIVEPMGANTLINFRLGESSILVRLDGYSAEQPGERLDLMVDMNRAVLIDPESERVI
jgi:multiple sugar transport system ATP-binding protein